MPTGPDAAPDPAAGARAISERGLAALRVAATLVHGVPGLEARLQQGRAVVAEVRRGGPGAETAVGPGAPRLLNPCEFRAAVSVARARHERGERLALPGVAGDPDIHLVVPASGETFPGGIHRVPCADRWLYVFALCGHPGRLAPLVESVVGEGESPRPAGRLGLRPDEGLGTALCFFEVDGSPRPADQPIVDLLGRLLARFTVEELCADPQPAW